MAIEAEVERMVATLTGNATDYYKMLNEARQATTAFAASVASAFAGVGVTAMVQAWSAAWGEQARAQMKLSVAIEESGRPLEATKANYNEFAAALQRVSTVADQTTIAMLGQAEMWGKTGDEAKNLIGIATALSGVNGRSAESNMMVARFIADGNLQYAKRALGLRDVKNEAELLDAVQKRLAVGLEIQNRMGQSGGGKLAQLRNEYNNLQESLGKVVAEGMKPWTEWALKAVQWANTWSDSTKLLIVQVATFGAGLLMLGPALRVINFLFQPLVAGLSMLFQWLVVFPLKLIAGTALWLVYGAALVVVNGAKAALAVTWAILSASGTTWNVIAGASVGLMYLLSGGLSVLTALTSLWNVVLSIGTVPMASWVIMGNMMLSAVVLLVPALLAAKAVMALYTALTLIHTMATTALTAATAAYTAALVTANLAMAAFFLLAASSALTLITAGIGLVVGAVYGLISAVGGIGAAFGSLYSDAVTPLQAISDLFVGWGGIISAVVRQVLAGDFAGAWSLVSASAKLALNQIYDLFPPLWGFMKEGFRLVMAYVVDVFKTSVTLMGIYWDMKFNPAASKKQMDEVMDSLEIAIKAKTGTLGNDLKKASNEFWKGFKPSDATNEAKAEVDRLLKEVDKLPSSAESLKGLFGKLKIAEPIKEATSELRKFDAALFGSTDAVVRYQLYLDRLEEGKPGKKGHGGASSASASSPASPLFSPPSVSEPAGGGAGGASAPAATEKNTLLLTQIRDGINQLVEAKVIEFEAAGLGS